MISFHRRGNSDKRIIKYAYIFRLNENKYVSKYILNQSINIEESKQQEPKEAIINFPEHSTSRKTVREYLCLVLHAPNQLFYGFYEVLS